MKRNIYKSTREIDKKKLKIKKKINKRKKNREERSCIDFCMCEFKNSSGYMFYVNIFCTYAYYTCRYVCVCVIIVLIFMHVRSTLMKRGRLLGLWLSIHARECLHDNVVWG